MVSKRKTLLLIVTNSFLLKFGLWQLIYFHEGIFINLNNSQPQLTQGEYVLLNMIPGILTIIIYIGLFWLMRLFKEHKWLQSGLYVFFAGKLIAVVLVPIMLSFPIEAERLYNWFGRLPVFITTCTIMYVFITLFLVKGPGIRKYYVLFACSSAMIQLLYFISPVLFEDYGVPMLNTSMLFYLPFIVLLALFINIYKRDTAGSALI